MRKLKWYKIFLFRFTHSTSSMRLRFYLTDTLYIYFIYGEKERRKVSSISAIILSVKESFKRWEKMRWFCDYRLYTKKYTVSVENNKESDLDEESERRSRRSFLPILDSPDFSVSRCLSLPRSFPSRRRIPSKSPPWEYTSPVDFYLLSRRKRRWIGTTANAPLWAPYLPNVGDAWHDKWYQTTLNSVIHNRYRKGICVKFWIFIEQMPLAKNCSKLCLIKNKINE